MSGLCGYACPIPSFQIKSFEHYFFYSLNSDLVTDCLQYENGKFNSKLSDHSVPFDYRYFQTLKRKDFYLNTKENKSVGFPLLSSRSYLIASALKMPAMIK